jgi:hypothetical protein
MNIAEKLRAAYQDDTDPLCWVAASEIEQLRAAAQHEADVAEAYKAEADALLAAAKSALDWDKRRKYIMPYRVREPLIAAVIDSMKGGE